MSASLESYVNRPVSVITADGRNFVGTLKVEHTENTIMVSVDVFYWQGFDQTINLILDETHERVYSPGQGVEQVSGGGDLELSDHCTLGRAGSPHCPGRQYLRRGRD